MALGMRNVAEIAVSFFLVAILGPIGIGYISNATTVNWDPAVTTIFQVLLPILWAIGIAITYIPKRGD